ncbi:hypothetical protein, partial [Flammeovirga sp. SJP92]|uniref:hypothetical protein n=1 Tax=Flammeovirga sp. SJP92 TaxID=1775430 RepID=UPI001560C58D
FGDLWEFKNETSWDNVNEDAFMTINADQAKKYFGDGGPKYLFEELLQIDRTSENNKIIFNRKQLDIVFKNLYKDQQNYDYAYHK